MAEAPAALAEPAAERATASPTESNLAGAIRNRIGAEAREPDDNGDVGGDEFRARFDDAFQRNPEPVARPLRGGSSSNLPALQKEPRRWTARLAWIALIVFVAGIIGGAVLFQDSITKSWPASKRLYDLISVSDGSMKKKLGVRSVQYTYPTPTSLKIDGELVNLSKALQDVPNLRVLFLDASGKVVKRWTFPPRERRMLPDEVIKFSTEIQNPPADAKRIDVGLDIK
jgi:hypothetical protein